MSVFSPYRKAIVPVAVAAVLWALNQVGVTPDMNVKEAATLVVTSLIVFFVPNEG